mmetsp:Transcript_68947/g.214014  ORF Transcript_68947/g.214014 Transcript_68947/m.214014 type:complete len:315 (+) Transcript_68947:386-1330(+)
MGQVPQPLHVTPGCWARNPVTPAAAFCHHRHGPRSAPDAGSSSANSASKRSADASASRTCAWKGKPLATRMRPSKALPKPAPSEEASAASNAVASGPKPGVSAAIAARDSRSRRQTLLRPLLAAWSILSTFWATRWANAGSPCKTRDVSIVGVSKPPSRKAQAANRKLLGPAWQARGPAGQSSAQASARPGWTSGHGPRLPSECGSPGRSPSCRACPCGSPDCSPTCPAGPEGSPTVGTTRSLRIRRAAGAQAACCARKSSKVCGVNVQSPSSSWYFTQLWKGASPDCGARSGRTVAIARDTESYVGSSCRIRR